ncbi:MAG: hypothetical protein JW779_02575 [Candidatus Thorarchaeota archaeon]|nr:hypothetical protein [Candidatus Thorarchaeota archaeon]
MDSMLALQIIYTIEQLVATGGILVFLIAIIIWVAMSARDAEEIDFFKDRKNMQASKATTLSESSASDNEKPSSDINVVRVLRGGAFIGNRIRFKVKVANESEYTITDIMVHLVSYPRDALRFDGDDDAIHFSKIEPGGFRSPSFEFIPTQDCVRGEIVAGVTYIDTRGKAHTQTTRPYEIRAVCDLLIPEEITPEDFQQTVQSLHSGELVVSVDDWTPQEMYEKALVILEQANFSGVSAGVDSEEDVVTAKIEGWARGKYTDKGVGVQLLISGRSGEKGACCTIRILGEDSALVLPAIEDLRNRLTTWLCPKCRSTLQVESVKQLRKGGVVECPYCGVTIGR